MNEKGEKISVYKIQLYAGFGGENKEIKVLIREVLKDIKIMGKIK